MDVQDLVFTVQIFLVMAVFLAYLYKLVITGDRLLKKEFDRLSEMKFFTLGVLLFVAYVMLIGVGHVVALTVFDGLKPVFYGNIVMWQSWFILLMFLFLAADVWLYIYTATSRAVRETDRYMPKIGASAQRR